MRRARVTADGLPPLADPEGGQSTERPSLASLQAEIERLKAVQYILVGDLVALRQAVAAAGVNVPASMAESAEWLTLKQATGICGYSPSGLRRRIAHGQTRARHIGGRLLIDLATLPKSEKAS